MDYILSQYMYTKKFHVPVVYQTKFFLLFKGPFYALKSV